VRQPGQHERVKLGDLSDKCADRRSGPFMHLKA
jgi:hypothetical protein